MNYLFNEVGEKSFSSWVFTIPEQYREFFRSKINLDKLRHALIGVFVGKRCHGVWKGGLGYKYGVSVFHYCGDNGKIYNPHLNLLLFKKNDGKWNKIKLNLVRNILRRVVDKVVAPSESVLKKMEKKYKCYSFKRNYGLTYGQCLHRWKYAVRPTFRVFSHHINEVYSGYRNIRWFGTYKNKIEQNFIEKIENMICPVPSCNSPIHKSFMSNVKYSEFKHDEHYHLGAGIYIWRKKLTKKGLKDESDYNHRVLFNCQKRKTKKELVYHAAVERERKQLSNLLLKLRTPDVVRKIRGCFLTLLRKENEAKYFGYKVEEEKGNEVVPCVCN